MKKRFVCVVLLLAAAAITVWPKEQGVPPALLQIITTERAFAKLSVERGVRESFMTYFAPDGINFTPHPSLTVERFRARPAPAKLPPVTLNWAPVYGDVAASGELGFSTGPVLTIDRSGATPKESDGMFFSIWKRQPDEKWRVVVDLGIQVPRAFAPLDAPFQPARGAGQTVKPSGKQTSMLDANREFFALAQSAGQQAAWRKFLSDDARIYRPDTMPIIGKQALASWAATQGALLAPGGGWMPTPNWTKTETAQSGEWGYVSGGYELKDGGGERGYYVRVWRRDSKGVWRIVMDVTAPLPAK